MKTMMLFISLVSQFAFAQKMVGIVAVPEVMLISTALRAPHILREVSGGIDFDITNLEVKPVPNSQLKFEITVHHENSKTNEKKSKTFCAELEFTSGPGRSKDGKSAAVTVPGPDGDKVDMSDSLWMFVNYQPNAC